MNFTSKQPVLISIIAILILQAAGLLFQLSGMGGFLYSVIGSSLILTAVSVLFRKKTAGNPVPSIRTTWGNGFFRSRKPWALTPSS